MRAGGGRYTSSNLSFHILTTESAPTTFSDLNLSLQPGSFDLPLLVMYYRGMQVGRLPGDGRVRKSAKQEKEEEEEEEVESEDERDEERRKGIARMAWDTSERSIVEGFGLKLKSNLT